MSLGWRARYSDDQPLLNEYGFTYIAPGIIRLGVQEQETILELEALGDKTFIVEVGLGDSGTVATLGGR